MGDKAELPAEFLVSFHFSKLFLAMACACAAWPSAARADDTRVDELARQLRDVQRQLNELKTASSRTGEVVALRQSSAAQFADLHKRMDAQTRVGMPNGRLTAVSSDGAFSLALRATVQFDAGHFMQGRNPPGVDLNSGTNFRRAQFGFVGTAWRDWSYNFTYDFGGSGTEKSGYLYRAYIEYDGLAPVGFRVGAFSAYDSMEDATGGANLALMERPTAVTIARGIGAGSGREGAEVFAQGERYLVSLALTGGKTGDAATFDEQQAVVGRVAWLAMDRGDVKWLLNVDATHVFKPADVTAGPAASGAIALSAGPELSIDGSRTVDTGLLDARHVTEFGMETALSLGRLFGQGGWFHYDIARRSAVPDPSFQGWYAMATWSLSGETRPYDPVTASFHGLIPDAPLGKNGFGAWEIVARYSNMDLDFRPGDAGGVTGGVQNIWSIGLNWYPNQTVRFLLDYNNIRVSHSNAPGNDISANAVALRSQIAF
jgi:phosphate-selective porin OprO/OprP